MDKPLEQTWHPAIDELQSRVKGQVLVPLDREYDAVRRIWNGMIDRRPAAILRCREAGDIPPALAWCRDHGMDFSVRGGGHNIAGSAVCDGGLMIDLSPMKAVRVDPAKRRAVVEPGAKIGRASCRERVCHRV